MTMDIYQGTSQPLSMSSFAEMCPTTSTEIRQMAPSLVNSVKKPVRQNKRSFDVAFLMAPDDLSKKRERKCELKKQLLMQEYTGMVQHFAVEPISLVANLNVDGSNRDQRSPLSLMVPPEKMKIKRENRTPDHETDIFPKSAFTKVTSSPFIGHFDSIPMPSSPIPPVAISPSSVSSAASGRSGVSPELTYQESLSPQSFTSSNRSPVSMLSCDPKNPFQNPLLSPYFMTSQNLLKDVDKRKHHTHVDSPAVKHKSTKSSSSSSPNDIRNGNFLYSGENLSLPYGGLSINGFPFHPGLPQCQLPNTSTIPMFPSAAAAALLPTSLAAFALPAQNICAKCNMNFRMTSDLVYHMRSHHKNENAFVDPYRKRREQDKLKCPVCNESFRERHHLTRHMTAHQDKEGDEDVSQELIDITTQRSVLGSSTTTK